MRSLRTARVSTNGVGLGTVDGHGGAPLATIRCNALSSSGLAAHPSAGSDDARIVLPPSPRTKLRDPGGPGRLHNLCLGTGATVGDNGLGEGGSRKPRARLAALLGTTVDDVLARTVLDFVFEEDRPLAQERIGQNLAGQPEQFDFRFRRAIGAPVEVLACTSPVRADDSAVGGALGMFSDITALRELERAREEFLSSAAHDLKTPLTSIRGQAQLAQRRLTRLDNPETAPALVQLARIQEGTDAMVGLIDELVDVTRQQMGGGLELHRAPVDLVALVQGSVEAHRDASGRLIHLEMAESELHADVDAARVGRVVGNLLSNALKYSPAESAIWVRLWQEDGAAGPEAVLVVRDEGIGIPAADLAHIFDRFARAGNVVGHFQGTGIGLASARGIVEQHGGTIAVESTEGVGSTFTVRLPLTDPAVEMGGGW